MPCGSATICPTALSLTTFSIMVNQTQHSAELKKSIVMLSVIYTDSHMPSVTNKLLMLSVIMLDVIMLNVVAPAKQLKNYPMFEAGNT